MDENFSSIRKLNSGRVVAEDIDDNYLTVNITADGRLRDNELLSFVKVYFSNELSVFDCKNDSSTKHEHDHRGATITWVENSRTGELMPVARQVIGSSEDATHADELNSSTVADLETGGGRPGAASGEDDSSPLLLPYGPPTLLSATESGGPVVYSRDEDSAEVVSTVLAFNDLVVLQRGVFLLFQGMLAGFAFTTLYLRESTGGDDAQLLLRYQPNAQEYRRYFYLLSTIALIGSADSLLTITNSRAEGVASGAQRSSAYGRIHTMLQTSYGGFSLGLVILVAVLHAAAFLCTLLMTAQDVRIATRNGYEPVVGEDPSTWAAAALGDISFREGLALWKGLDQARLACALAAWLGCCVFVWNGLTQLNARSADVFKVGEVASAWKARVALLEGDRGLDRLSEAELRRLVHKQSVGLERARLALSYFEGTAAAASPNE